MTGRETARKPVKTLSDRELLEEIAENLRQFEQLRAELEPLLALVRPRNGHTPKAAGVALRTLMRNQ